MKTKDLCRSSISLHIRRTMHFIYRQTFDVIDIISLWLDCYQTANNVLLMMHKSCSPSQMANDMQSPAPHVDRIGYVCVTVKTGSFNLCF